MQSTQYEFQRRQIVLIARVTPYAMVGHLANTAVIAIALAGSVQPVPLIIWCAYSCSTALLLLVRHVKNRERSPRSFQRAAKKVTIYAFFLALPWSSLAILYLGSLAQGEELILVALGIGMAACATALLSAIPRAALGYISVILIPTTLKCLLVGEKGYLLLGALALSYWGCMAALIAKTSRDIKERQESELVLAERNAQLALAGRAVLVGSYAYDVNKGAMQVSEGYAAIHGLREGTTETTISEWRARVHPEDLERAEELRDQAFADHRKEDNAEYRIVLSNGEVRWIERRGSISYGADGHPERVVGVNIDITDRKTAELALAERDAQLALAGKAARVGSFAIDVGTGMVQISPGYASVHGSAEGTEEFPRDEWRARVHPDDLGRIEALRSQAIAEQCREHNTEYRIVGPDGKTRWIEARALFSYNSNGHPMRIVGVDIDITERKRAEALLEESEARYRALYDDNPSMYFTVVSSGTVLSVNEFGAQQLGYTAAELVGQSVLKVIHHEDHEAARQHLASCTQANQTVSTTELRKVSRDGSIIWVREVARAVREPGQQRTVILIVCEEITERKRVEEQQRTLVAELDHRVKNVLATVQAVAAHTMETSSSMHHFVAALDGRIRSMGSTHELLSHRQWEGIPLAELVERQLAPYTTGSNIEIAGPEVMLSADAGQTMAMALHELATNAAKYGALSTPRGRISVRWRLGSNGRGPATLKLDWHEEGGPVVTVPGKTGFGTSVVRDLIPYELGGTIDHVLAPEGVRCQMEISLAQLCVGSLQTMDLHRRTH